MSEETDADIKATEEEYDYYDYESQPSATERRIERRFSIVATSALIIALASLVTAGTTMFMFIQSSGRSDERMAQLVAALQDQQPVVINNTQGGLPPDPNTPDPNNPNPQNPGAATQPGQPGQPAQPGQPPGQPQQLDQPGAQPGAPAPAAGAAPPAPTSDELLRNAMAAAEPGVPGSQLAAHAVDGQAAAGTLEKVAEVRSKMAPPPGLQYLGNVVNFEVTDVVANGDTATATLKVVWPAGLGEWTYPDSGFQYVDGEWKLQKSTVCNLASAAWVDCY